MRVEIKNWVGVVVLLFVGFVMGRITVRCAPGIMALHATQLEDSIRKKENWVIKIYPYSQEDMWRASFLSCEKRGYKIKEYDKSNGFIETGWKNEKYSPSVTPPDFVNKMKQYGSPIDPGNIKWTGMRYKLTIFAIQLTTDKTRVRVQARMDGFSYSGSQMWRWWNSNGTLEEYFLLQLEKELGYIPPISE